MIVLDASVVAKWFLPEEYQKDAQALLAGDEQLFAPSLIRLEVSAAIVRRLRLDSLEESIARQACAEWASMLDAGVIQLIPDEELFDSALALAFQMRHALQDCLYLAAAMQIRSELVTADRKFAERGRKISGNIRLLGGGHAN